MYQQLWKKYNGPCVLGIDKSNKVAYIIESNMMIVKRQMGVPKERAKVKQQSKWDDLAFSERDGILPAIKFYNVYVYTDDFFHNTFQT